MKDCATTVMNRRTVLKMGAGLTACCAAGLPHALGALQKIPIGVQLYSVRKQCGEDLPATLRAIAEMGYQGVEFAGYYGRTAPDLKRMLDDLNLKCCGTHTGINTVLGDALKETIEFNRILGNRYLIVPSLPKERLASADACRETARVFTEQAAKAKEAGMVIGYHAHGGDFRKFEDGQTPWDVFFGAAGPAVVMQLDTGNCLGGGGDPLAVLRKFPGRSVTIHLKEHGGAKAAAIGEGGVPWKAVFEICETTGKTEWYIVEHESGNDPLGSIRTCLANLRAMGK